MSEFQLFAVAGKPVLHSISPQVHNAGFASLGISAAYIRLSAGSGSEAIATARQMGISGLSVTAPFKEEVFGLCKALDPNARATGAVNTVLIGRRVLSGFNTDVDGVRLALEQNGVRISKKRAVVIGAGGAARAAAFALRKAGASVTIANRTRHKAEKLAREFGCASCGLEKKELSAALSDAGILVSTVSTHKRLVPASMLRKGMAILDAHYARKTALMSDANRKGCKVLGPQEWLLCQGLAAFKLFSGRKAPEAAMRKAVDSAFAARSRKLGGSIALVGMMGSGKSTTAGEIARISGMRAVETDAMVERKQGMSIGEIFRKHGEAYFRRLEREAIAEACSLKRCVISCGGGAVLDRQNVAMLRRSCVVAWLWATPEESLRRIRGDITRPLYNVKNRLQLARRVMRARLPLYAQASDLTVQAGGRKPSEIAEGIMDEISHGR
ncbi:TPA: NAD(P)-binding domain-containing protein [Candidatus Micrarchaeota archaeon]|nr:NAD(P)-binding domain-containing protein [Candidatus Micrarchaeota archaeon]